MKTITTRTYAEIEKQLISDGFKFEVGEPSMGIRFKKKKEYAIILRMGDLKFETIFYHSSKPYVREPVDKDEMLDIFQQFANDRERMN